MNHTAGILLAMLTAVLLQLNTFAQDSTRLFISGQVIDNAEHVPIPYARVHNKTTGKGTITDLNGNFEISLSSFSDSVFISFTGYKKQVLAINQAQSFYLVTLEENTRLLNEVAVFAPAGTLVSNLLHQCRKNKSEATAISKTYFQLSSYVNGRQVELVQCFYNGTSSGYDMHRLDLKAGRIALQENNNRFFVSMESSRAITMLQLFEHNSYFPVSPLELSKKQMRSDFQFYITNKYLEAQDTIYMVNFKPNGDYGKHFEGTIWINPEKKQIEKINLYCSNAVHPFLPIFRSDSIKNVQFNITKTFRETGEGMAFSEVDFTYSINYKGKDNDYYKVTTSAVLYAYAPGESFMLPKFEFTDPGIADYRKINAFPYNDFFWKNQDEFALADLQDKSELFFNDSLSLTNKTIFRANEYLKNGLLEHPYMQWSDRRITFREFERDSTNEQFYSPHFVSNFYHLGVKLFLDMNAIGDSIQVVTATVFDPYDSFYSLEMDKATLCFINIYFDLIEIERRKLEAALIGKKTYAEIEQAYQQSMNNISLLNEEYFKTVERGLNREALEKWNAYVAKQLAIDNIGLFAPYAEKTEE